MNKMKNVKCFFLLVVIVMTHAIYYLAGKTHKIHHWPTC